MSSSVAIETPRVADLAVDVGPLVGIEAVERDRVERGGQALRRQVARQQVEAPVGAERVAFAREHARRILVLALEGNTPAVNGKLAGQVLAQAASAGSRPGPRTSAARPCGTWVPDSDVVREPRADLLAADLHDVLVAGVRPSPSPASCRAASSRSRLAARVVLASASAIAALAHAASSEHPLRRLASCCRSRAIARLLLRRAGGSRARSRRSRRGSARAAAARRRAPRTTSWPPASGACSA